jgi:hypothetical protein
MCVGIRTYILTRCIIHILGICIVDIHVGTISVFAHHCNDDVIGHVSGSSIMCIHLFIDGAFSFVGADALVLLALVSLLAPAAGGLVSLVLASALFALLASVRCCAMLLPPFLLLVGRV